MVRVKSKEAPPKVEEALGKPMCEGLSKSCRVALFDERLSWTHFLTPDTTEIEPINLKAASGTSVTPGLWQVNSDYYDPPKDYPSLLKAQPNENGNSSEPGTQQLVEALPSEEKISDSSSSVLTSITNDKTSDQTSLKTEPLSACDKPRRDEKLGVNQFLPTDHLPIFHEYLTPELYQEVWRLKRQRRIPSTHSYLFHASSSYSSQIPASADTQNRRLDSWISQASNKLLSKSEILEMYAESPWPLTGTDHQPKFSQAKSTSTEDDKDELLSGKSEEKDLAASKDEEYRPSSTSSHFSDDSNSSSSSDLFPPSLKDRTTLEVGIDSANQYTRNLSTSTSFSKTTGKQESVNYLDKPKSPDLPKLDLIRKQVLDRINHKIGAMGSAKNVSTKNSSRSSTNHSQGKILPLLTKSRKEAVGISRASKDRASVSTSGSGQALNNANVKCLDLKVGKSDSAQKMQSSINHVPLTNTSLDVKNDRFPKKYGRKNFEIKEVGQDRFNLQKIQIAPEHSQSKTCQSNVCKLQNLVQKIAPKVSWTPIILQPSTAQSLNTLNPRQQPNGPQLTVSSQLKLVQQPSLTQHEVPVATFATNQQPSQSSGCIVLPNSEASSVKMNDSNHKDAKFESSSKPVNPAAVTIYQNFPAASVSSITSSQAGKDIPTKYDMKENKASKLPEVPHWTSRWRPYESDFASSKPAKCNRGIVLKSRFVHKQDGVHFLISQPYIKLDLLPSKFCNLAKSGRLVYVAVKEGHILIDRNACKNLPSHMKVKKKLLVGANTGSCTENNLPSNSPKDISVAQTDKLKNSLSVLNALMPHKSKTTLVSSKSTAKAINAHTMAATSNAVATFASTNPTTPSVSTNLMLSSVSTNPITSSVSTNPITFSVSTNPIASSVSNDPITSSVSTNPLTSSVSTNPLTSSVSTNPITTSASTNPTTPSVSTNLILSSLLADPITSPVLTNPITSSAPTKTIAFSVSTNPITSSASTNPITFSVSTDTITSYASTNPITSFVSTKPVLSSVSTNSATPSVLTNPITSSLSTNSVTSAVSTNSFTTVPPNIKHSFLSIATNQLPAVPQKLCFVKRDLYTNVCYNLSGSIPIGGSTVLSSGVNFPSNTQSSTTLSKCSFGIAQPASLPVNQTSGSKQLSKMDVNNLNKISKLTEQANKKVAKRPSNSKRSAETKMDDQGQKKRSRKQVIGYKSNLTSTSDTAPNSRFESRRGSPQKPGSLLPSKKMELMPSHKHYTLVTEREILQRSKPPVVSDREDDDIIEIEKPTQNEIPVLSIQDL